MNRTYAFVTLAFVFSLAACSKKKSLSQEELMKPESCMECHPSHFEEWQSSMHAYAADDPVFLAMNKRGQRETNGELGDFCVKCHAPIALATGATFDGLNLPELPQHLKGVTCYFCHSVEKVEGTHNNPLVLAQDGRLRGGIDDPVPNDAHKTAYSVLHDRRFLESSQLCGSCHDIVTPSGVHLERTYKEWQESVFAKPDPKGQLSCGQCHMVGDQPGIVADVEGVPARFPHSHSFPGVDLAISDWPGKAEQRALIQKELDSVLIAELCVSPGQTGVTIQYTLDNAFAGHKFPSGAAHDRRAWAEIQAFDGQTPVYTSGVVSDGQALDSLNDPSLWQMRDFVFDAQDNPVHMFWDVAKTRDELLTQSITNDMSDPAFYHSVSREYSYAAGVPERVTARVLLRPMGLDVLDDLIESGDLDASFRTQIETFELASTVLEWNMSDGFGCVSQ